MHWTKNILKKIFDKQFIRFVIVGTGNTLLGYSLILFFSHKLKFHYAAANITTYSIGLILMFVLHKNWVFESKKSFKNEILPFLIIFLIGFFLNLAVLIISVNFLHIHKDIGQLLGIGAYATCNYLGNKFWTFGLS